MNGKSVIQILKSKNYSNYKSVCQPYIDLNVETTGYLKTIETDSFNTYVYLYTKTIINYLSQLQPVVYEVLRHLRVKLFHDLKTKSFFTTLLDSQQNFP